MTNRRHFLKIGGLSSLLAAMGLSSCETEKSSTSEKPKAQNKPIVISTWEHGIEANASAWKILSKGGSALDAVEQGVRTTESDPNVSTVGIGGRPDRNGVVSLDACIMNEEGDCGSVAFLQNIEHPISVARKVMEETQHVMLVGQGALDFAKEQGFEEKNLLTEAAEADWKKWLESNSQDARPEINVENHDTIGMVALDEAGNLSGACTTSGAAWKLHGRVGDSPIIGAGLYVDNEVGAATATGWGEAVIRAVGCFLVVEFMRQGHSPEDACRLAVERVISKNPDWKEIQVGFLALNKAGEHGSYCIQPGFDYALYDQQNENVMIKAKSKV
ncbi:MAG: N(4)-(beta-N-acetylglucosaminyl)-L-asparaginase [Bacteroidota bacterium]